jgi:hypothetical protein
MSMIPVVIIGSVTERSGDLLEKYEDGVNCIPSCRKALAAASAKNTYTSLAADSTATHFLYLHLTSRATLALCASNGSTEGLR